MYLAVTARAISQFPASRDLDRLAVSASVSGGLAGSSIIHNYSLPIGATKTFSQTWLADFRFGWFKYNPQTHKAFEGATPMITSSRRHRA